MTKEQIKAFGGAHRFRPFVIVLKSGRRIEIKNQRQMAFALHPDEAIIYYQGSLRVLALSSIDHLELIPFTERLRRFLDGWPERQLLAGVAVQVISVGAITALFWLSVLSQLKRMHQ